MPQQQQQLHQSQHASTAAPMSRAEAMSRTRVLPSSPDGFMAHTLSFQQQLDQKPTRLRSRHEAEYERVALHALWRGVGHRGVVDRNLSTQTQASIQWDERHRMSSADRAPAADMRPAGPPQARPAQPPPAPPLPNPLHHYPRADQEARMAKRAMATILGVEQQQPSWAQVQMQRRGEQRPNSGGRSGDERATATPVASSTSDSRPHSAAEAQPAQAQPAQAQRAARAPYVPVHALRDADGVPLKIGSFPAPTPLDPNDPAYGNFRSDAWTSDQRFFFGSQRGADLAPSAPCRDPAMDDPLFSSFSSNGVFEEAAKRQLPPPYRCKESVARPRADGSYVYDYQSAATAGGDPNGQGQGQPRLFMQRLVRSDSRPKAEMRFAGSAVLPPAVEEARAAAVLRYVTVLESEERKRRRKEKADNAERAAERLAQRREAAHYNRERARSPGLAAKPGRRGARSHDGVERQWSHSGGGGGDEMEAGGSQYGGRADDAASSVASRSTSPPRSPSRSASPNSFERMQAQQHEQQRFQVPQGRAQQYGVAPALSSLVRPRPASAAAFQVVPAPLRHSSDAYASRINVAQMQQQPIDTRTQQAFAALFA